MAISEIASLRLSEDVILRNEVTKNLGVGLKNMDKPYHPDTLRGVYTERSECAQGDIDAGFHGKERRTKG